MHIVLITVKGIVTIAKVGNDTIALANNKTMTNITFKYCLPFTNCAKEININQIDKH